MPLKLDLKDRKILAMLDENARFSNSQIARRVGLSKPAVEHRIRRFEKNSVIFELFTVINFSKLGFSQYKLYFKLQNASLEDEKRIIGYWSGCKGIVWAASTRGSWDIAVSALARSNFEFGRLLSGFMHRFSHFVLDKAVLLTEHSAIYERRHLAGAKPMEFLYGIPAEPYHLDDSGIRILRILATNARLPVVELAKKAALSRDVVNYRMKKLVKDGIIIRHRCELNLPAIGMQLYKVIVRARNLDEHAEKQLSAYAALHATQILKLIGPWDIEIEFEVQGEDELYIQLADFRKKFSAIIRDFEVLRISRTFKYDYFPF